MQDESAQLVSCIPHLRRYARALVGDRAGADDLVQATMERGWNKLASWRRGTDMRAWLFGIMHNLHVDGVRKPVITSVEIDDDTPLPFVNAPQTYIVEIRDMEFALKMAPAEQREILLLVAPEK